MSAARNSTRALKHLSARNVPSQSRGLHMTGPQTYSNLLTSQRPSAAVAGDVAGLRAECQKRKLPVNGTKAELIDRLSAHELAGSTRSFSTAIQDSKRPSASAPSTDNTRHFNTSRSLKSPGDTSTIDFAYLPDFDPDMASAPAIRVPRILPTGQKMYSAEQQMEEPVIRPTINTIAADGTHIHAPSAMSDVSDNNSIDFQGMAAKVAEKLGGVPIEQNTGAVKAVWSGFLDDLLGPKGGPAKA